MKTFFIVAAMVCIAGCNSADTTIHGRSSHTQLGPDTFLVSHTIKRVKNPDVLQDGAMLDAADLCLASGFRYFIILSESSAAGNRGGVISEFGSTKRFGQNQSFGVITGGGPLSARLRIRCLKEQTDDALDAVFVAGSIRKKYELAPKNLPAPAGT